MAHRGGGLDGEVRTGTGFYVWVAAVLGAPAAGEWRRLPALRGPGRHGGRGGREPGGSAHPVGQLSAGDQPEYLMADMDAVSFQQRVTRERLGFPSTRFPGPPRGAEPAELADRLESSLTATDPAPF